MLVSYPISAYIHLAYGFGAENWNRRWKSGTLIGVNEPFAYGYHRAAAFNCKVKYSTDHAEGPVSKAARYCLRLLLGFDIVHAWRNRRAIFSADVIWTHTESQALAVAAVLKLKGGRRPRTIFQSVWLIDRWLHFNIIRRIWYKYLLSTADILSFLSAENANEARKIFPEHRIEHVLFGINADLMVDSDNGKLNRPVRVLSVGNDADRDWATLRAAFMGHEGYVMRVVTSRLPKDYLKGNAEVVRANNNDVLLELYRWADVIVVPLKANLHASGITVIQEATTQGRMVVATDTGGLREYFPPGEVLYVEIGDPDGLRKAVEHVVENTNLRTEMVRRAQLRMSAGAVNSVAFVKKHVEWSRSLIESSGH